VLLLELDPREVDVNVHPSKLEVRLRNAPWMHAVLADRLHKGLLDASRRLAFGARESAPSGNPPRAAGPAPWGQLELPAAVSDVRTAAAPAAASGPERPGLNPPAPAALRAQPAGAADLIGNPYGGGGFHFQPLSGRTGGGAAGEAAARDGAPAAAPGGALAGGMTALGQLHRTYILAQRADALLVIDQHAAHERILFEQYRGQFYRGKLVTERYLIPLTLDLSAQNGLLLEQYLPQWRRLGFEIEAFGRDSYAVRQIPGLLAGKDIGRLILEVLDELALFGKSGRMEEAINEILERVACHAAIRGGQTLSREEMDALLAQVEGLDINLYCPHGRPVWVEVGQRELEKRFKRLV
jgi:DNA mismatch repair protein MutL